MCRTRVVVAAIMLLLVSACSSGGTSSGGGSSTPGTSTKAPATTAAAVAPVPAGKLPTACSQLPVTLITDDIGTISVSQALPDKEPGVSCEWANPSAKAAVIITVGHGDEGAFTTLKTRLSAIETVAAIPDFEADAFSVSKGSLVRGVTALTASGEMIVVETSLSQAQDQALVVAVATSPF